MSEWRPIETMPPDIPACIVCNVNTGHVSPYVEGIIHNIPGTNYDWGYGEEITHWMPLPEPPK